MQQIQQTQQAQQQQHATAQGRRTEEGMSCREMVSGIGTPSQFCLNVMETLTKSTINSIKKAFNRKPFF